MNSVQKYNQLEKLKHSVLELFYVLFKRKANRNKEINRQDWKVISDFGFPKGKSFKNSVVTIFSP